MGERLLFVGVVAGAAVWYTGALRFLPHTKSSVAGAVVVEPDAPAGGLVAVKARGNYESIVTSGLFGDAGTAHPEAPPPPPPEAAEKETELRLQLCGTAATEKPKDLFASALIANLDDNRTARFFVGQQVVENVTLEEIFPKKVILFNKNANRREVLKADVPEGDTKTASAQPAAKAPTAPPPPSPSNRVTLKKAELVQEVVSNYGDLVTQVRPELYRDGAGNVAGLTAKNIESIPLAKTLDIRNGDVLQTVNNEAIDSEEKIMELVNKYRNTNTFRIGILRDGKPMVVTYKLE